MAPPAQPDATLDQIYPAHSTLCLTFTSGSLKAPEPEPVAVGASPAVSLGPDPCVCACVCVRSCRPHCLHSTPRELQHSSSQNVSALVRPRQEEADLGARPGRRGERHRAEAELQQTPALHAGQGQKCGHPEGLLLRPGPHGAGSLDRPMDQNPAALLREGSQSEFPLRYNTTPDFSTATSPFSCVCSSDLPATIFVLKAGSSSQDFYGSDCGLQSAQSCTITWF